MKVKRSCSPVFFHFACHDEELPTEEILVYSRRQDVVCYSSPSKPIVKPCDYDSVQTEPGRNDDFSRCRNPFKDLEGPEVKV